MMWRKILQFELRSVTRRSSQYFSRPDCIKDTQRLNTVKPICFSYSKYCIIRLQHQGTGQYKKCSQTVNIKTNLSHIPCDYAQSQVLETPYEAERKTFKFSLGPLKCLKSARDICSVGKPVVSEFSSQCAILPSGCASGVRYMSTGKDGFSSIRNRISSLHAKKRAPKKKKKIEDSEESGETVEGFAPVARHKFLTFDPDFTLPEIHTHRPLHRDWQVIAYATADEYDLDGLLKGLTQQGLYTAAVINPGNTNVDNGAHAPSPKGMKSTSHNHDYTRSTARHQGLHPAMNVSTQTSHSSTALPDAHDVLHMVATYQVGSENREMYFFREGSVVFWNVSELECSSILQFLKNHEKGSYQKDVIEEESENLTYCYSDTASKTRLIRNKIILNPEGVTDLEKYTFSNAMAMSVKLGIWEASLDKYIDDFEYVSEELSKSGRVVLSQNQVLQCMGQLCALRHLINLSSDLLDTPDFYWEHENLELLYQKTSNYLNISKRTSVMNVKLSHCIELMELLKSHLNEKHSARLEWIIIILIMIEVGFEVLHVLERWL